MLHIPPEDLTIGEPISPSPKSEPSEIDGVLHSLGQAERLIEQGWTAEQVEQLRLHPPGSREKPVGDAYHLHYNTMTNRGFIQASWHEGQLLVDNGRHRTDRAQKLAISDLPVSVWVPDEDVARDLQQKYQAASPSRYRERSDQEHQRRRG